MANFCKMLGREGEACRQQEDGKPNHNRNLYGLTHTHIKADRNACSVQENFTYKI